MKHTITNWSIVEGRIVLLDEAGTIVGEVFGKDKQRMDTAALIVHRVNTYEKLVAALEELRSAVGLQIPFHDVRMIAAHESASQALAAAREDTL